jgi:undecaprenyl-diphosphatase
MRHVHACLLLLLMTASGSAIAGGGPLGIDHEWAYDNHGIWARRYQSDFAYAVLATEGIGALWLGDDEHWGHEFWQSIDSTAVSGVTAEILKYAFSRARPYQGQGPNKWFQGSCCKSFPSSEVTLQASFVTPIILDETARGNYWIWALEALPIYDGIGRMKQQAHWQTDVLAGWALGTAVGYWSVHRGETPLSVEILPRGMTIGFHRRF